MLTVYEDSNHIFDALRAGAIGYLLKQTPFDKLSESLKQVCAGGSPMTGYIARKVVQSFQATQAADEKVESLSAREQEVLDMLAKGYLYKEISDKLEIGLGTVRTYVRRIYEKLHVQSRTQAVIKYLGQ